ncbi:DoxX family protein [Achromobacter sp. UMC71]|uniref:DoxX family protein n=1 Tax=Achromobacter sp. UMC71 TaxID=1862320 RepID=UPI00160440FE|nr:DoxX family protein [Achromobacter sp. UMC71]MBB1627352.1 DoxX family protein [Achromobacter sp. UMC71]
MQTPLFIDSLLQSDWLWFVARLFLAVVFLASGAAKLFDFRGGVAEMRDAGLRPATLFNILVAALMVGGSALILADRALWLAAAALGGFLVLTIVIVHAFWRLPPPQARLALFFALEHVSVVGGLIAAAIASHVRGLAPA